MPQEGALEGADTAGTNTGRPLSSLEAASLKAELWRNLEQRCAAAEARCAAMVTARAAAAESSLQALQLGLAGLQEEVRRS